MNILESKWLGARIDGLPGEEIAPIINLGSSTGHYRTVEQPHIDEHIFAPCRSRGLTVYHVDVKASPGVDIVGDVLDATFVQTLAARRPRSVIISNLLEHVVDPHSLGKASLKLLPPGGYLFVSGPKDYPYHADPIDTMFRPSISELHDLFPGTRLVDSAIIDSGNWRHWNTAERGRSLRRTAIRMLVPFRRPTQWWALARQTPYIIKHISAFAVVLQKLPEPPPAARVRFSPADAAWGQTGG